jgi:DNA adenine methylase
MAMRAKMKNPRPFIKWAGGKGQIIEKIVNHLPMNFSNYYEPFVGGGAVFFHLKRSGLSRYFVENDGRNKRKIILNDKIHDLISAYRVIRDDVGALVEELGNGQYNNTAAAFKKIRSCEPSDRVQRAARMIYLNKTCYNGLWRVNRSGKFNVPYAGNKNVTILDENNLHAVNKALQNVTIHNWDYLKIMKRAESSDLIYIDPPYYTEDLSKFTSYTANRFTPDDHIRLAHECARLHELGCKLLISNTAHPFISHLYGELGFSISPLTTKRMINCQPSGRLLGREFLIWNYETSQRELA